MDPIPGHAPDHPGWLPIRSLYSASTRWWQGAEVEVLEDGLEARLGGVLQRFRFEESPEHPGPEVWYALVEPEEHAGEQREGERVERPRGASEALAEQYDADVYAGSASVVDGCVRLRARVPLTAATEPPFVRWLASVASWQRRFLTEGARFEAPDTGNADGARIEAAEDRSPCGVDEAGAAFADHGVPMVHGRDWRSLTVRLPWTVRTSADESDAWCVMRMAGADVVTIDVRSDVLTPDGLGRRVELRLRVPADVDHAEARRWVARLNQAETSGDTPLVGIGAWSLDVSARTTALASWVHRARFPDGGGSVDWRAIAASSLERARWCFLGALPFFVHRHERVHSWLRPRGVEESWVGLEQPLGTSLARSRQVPDDVDPPALDEHLVACARSTRSGPWLDHVSRVIGLEALSRGRSWRYVLGTLSEWLRSSGGLAAATTWAWARTGGAESPVGAPQAAVERLPSATVVNLVAHAEARGIAVSWRPSFDPFVLGFALRPRLRTGLRSAAPPTELARLGMGTCVPVGSYHIVVDTVSEQAHWTEILVHELAHVLLGHVGGHGSVGRPTVVPVLRERLTHDVAEAEVTMVMSIVLARRGVVARRHVRQLARHLERVRADGEAKRIDMWHVFVAAERLLAWCLDAPETISRPEPAAGPRPVGTLQRATLRDTRSSAADEDDASATLAAVAAIRVRS